MGMADTRLRAFGKTSMGMALAAVVMSALTPSPSSAANVSPAGFEDVARHRDSAGGMKSFEAEMDRLGKQASVLERAEKVLEMERESLLARIGEFRELVSSVDDIRSNPDMSAQARLDVLRNALHAHSSLRHGGAMAGLVDVPDAGFDRPNARGATGVSASLEGFLSDVVKRMAEKEDTVFMLMETNAAKALLIDRMAEKLDEASNAADGGDLDAADEAWQEFDDLVHVRSRPKA